jgi:hypothetical protein
MQHQGEDQTMKMPNLRRVIVSAATVAAMTGVAVGVGAAPAYAYNGRPGQYWLCSRGTYASQLTYRNSGGFSSYIAAPGQCVLFNWYGDNVVDIYGFYPGGYRFYVGTDWWACSIVTYGDMGPGDYHWYQTGCG